MVCVLLICKKSLTGQTHMVFLINTKFSLVCWTPSHLKTTPFLGCWGEIRIFSPLPKVFKMVLNQWPHCELRIVALKSYSNSVFFCGKIPIKFGRQSCTPHPYDDITIWSEMSMSYIVPWTDTVPHFWSLSLWKLCALGDFHSNILNEKGLSYQKKKAGGAPPKSSRL